MRRREDANFEALVRVVSDETSCPLLLVEKDYWITLILKKLVGHFSDLIIFKGGTSLSKAWKLIDRFSEDVDILLNETLCVSRTQKRKRISEFRKFLETSPGLTYLPQSKQGDDHATLWYGYDSVFEQEPQAVLVEVGFRGGTQPSEHRKINSMIGELFDKRGHHNPKYSPFEICVLHLKRTLIEKLFALASAYQANNLPKKTRHYYDVYCVLQFGHLEDFSTTEEFLQLASDVAKHSLKNFGVSQDLSGLVNSTAFALSESDYAAVVRGYQADRHLYFRGQPDFHVIYKTVCDAIDQLRELFV